MSIAVIRALYKNPEFDHDLNVCSFIQGLVATFDPHEQILEHMGHPVFALENSIEVMSGWDKIVSLSDGKRLDWFIGMFGVEITHCFSGVPIPRKESDLIDDKQWVRVAEITNLRRENISISDFDIR